MIAERRDVMVVTLLAGLCCGCASSLVNARVPPPGSDAFQSGYVNGCASGFEDAGSEAFEHAYAKSVCEHPEYRSGWEQGHKACNEEERRHPRMSFRVTRTQPPASAEPKEKQRS